MDIGVSAHSSAPLPAAQQNFIKHMRKAGGSSLRDYLAHHVCTGPWLRRHTFINEGAIFDTSLFSSNSFVFVLTLREPIARIVSSYW